eukprot:TRINITY_DN18916_c0_g1_i5.p3 TRINITY_DN18916_c0_g1~~TRINITY_DN18916_c0_g1_i5.p3  ORF type:complete len:105 (-),score=17.65 TRINITY_DN18916_c0_g1_i5:273-587(-)
MPEEICCANCIYGTQTGEQIFITQFRRQLGRGSTREEKVAFGNRAAAAWNGLAASEKSQYNAIADEIAFKQDPANTDFTMYSMSEECDGYRCTHQHPAGVGPSY